MERPGEQKGGLLAYDNTMLKAYQDCPRYFYWRHVQHYKHLGYALPLWFGIAIHEALDHYYGGKELEDCFQAFLDIYRPVWEQSDQLDQKRSPEIGLAILGHYFAFYSREDEPWDVIAIEKGLEIVIGEDLEGRPIHYTMRIDLIVDWKDKGIVVIDHKSTWRITEALLSSVNPARQFVGYYVGAKEMWENVYGVMANYLMVAKTTRQCARSMVMGEQIKWAEWVTETLQIIEQLNRSFDTNTWACRTEYCLAWNRLCEYHPLCTGRAWPKDYDSIKGRVDPLYRVRVPESEFEIDKWDPFHFDDQE